MDDFEVNNNDSQAQFGNVSINSHGSSSQAAVQVTSASGSEVAGMD
jgi:hypothetical protein